MLCELRLNANLSTATHTLHNGAKITGQTSGATGFVHITKQDIADTASTIKNGSDATVTVMPANPDGLRFTAGTHFYVIQTTGKFQTGENITSSISEDFGGTAPAGGSVALHSSTAPVYFGMEDAHSLYSSNSGADYIADIFPADAKKLAGSVTVDSATSATTAITVKGTNTGFSSDLKLGDLIEVMDTGGTVRRFEVATITSDTSLTTVERFPVDVSGSTILRVRSKLEEQEELVMISKLPKPAIKTLKSSRLNNQVDTTLTVRRQRTVTLGSGEGSITLPDGESFTSFNVDDFLVSIYDRNGNTA